MDAGFWHQRWEKNNIGFHIGETNPTLVKHFNKLSLAKGCRVFIPLCGKTLDIGWLLARGYHVAGAELSPTAIEQLFQDLGLEPNISETGGIAHYGGENIDIFVGDVFQLSANQLGPVNAIYDRAALVALPEHMRYRYTAHLVDITQNAPQLLISFEYDQRLMEGPPFSVSAEELQRHYGDHYHLTLLESTDIAGGLKGRCPACEKVWLLRKAA